MLSLAFLFKIAVPPLLVAAMSLAARRWGATVGGLIMGLPWMTGPVLYFLARDKGEAFAVQACVGIELAVVGMGAFLLAYGFVSRLAPWWGSLAAAVAGFFGVGAMTQDLALPLPGATLAAAVALAASFVLLPKPGSSAVAGRLPWWDIPARMGCVLVLVAGIMAGADLLGPQRSGILASYPAILTVIGSFTHRQWGRDAVLRVLRGITLSLFSFVAFFAVVGTLLPRLGAEAAFALAALVALAVGAGLIAANDRMVRRARLQARAD
jgi:hypothetical protein